MSSDENTLVELVSLYIDGNASEEDCLRLSKVIGSDKAALAAVSDQVWVSRLLGQVNSRALDSEAVMRALPLSPGEMKMEPIMERADRERSAASRMWSGWALAIAALLLAAVGAWWWQNEWIQPGSNQVAGGVDDTNGLPRVVQGVVVAKVEKCSGVGFRMSGKSRRCLMVGDEIRANTGIETGTNSFVKLAFVGEATSVEIGAASGARFHVSDGGGKSVFIYRGKLTAVVAKRSGGAEFVVVTPHAEARVVGTTFDVLVSPESSELNVLQGKVQYTRLSDGKKLVVQEGKGAVAGQGREFSLGTCRYYPGGEYKDGAVLFQDDLLTNADNWDVLVSTNGRPLRLATEEERTRVIRKLRPDDRMPMQQQAKGMVLVAEKGETVAIRLKKPLPVVPMSLEFTRQVHEMTSLGVSYGDDVKSEVVRDFAPGAFEPCAQHRTRREIIPLEIVGDKQIVEERSYIWFMPRMISRIALVRGEGIVVTLTFSAHETGRKAVFCDVVIREMTKIGEAK